MDSASWSSCRPMVPVTAPAFCRSSARTWVLMVEPPVGSSTSTFPVHLPDTSAAMSAAARHGKSQSFIPASVFSQRLAVLAAKAATTTIPIVFELGDDPVRLGLVASLNRPGGNVTGVTQTNVEVAPKRLQLLHELVPTASVMALLVNPTDASLAETTTKKVQAAADTLGLELHVLNASTERDFDGVFAKLIQLRAGGLVISPGVFFTSRSEQLAALTLRHAVPTIFQYREFAVAGGLLSYGSDNRDSYRLAGVYTGRILKGDKPADLPVQQATDRK